MTENLIESICAALEPEASAEVRAAGATACRYILSVISDVDPPTASPAPPIEVGPTAMAIAGLIRNTPPERLLDLVIAKLRSVVPADAQPTTNHKMTIRYVQVPRP